MTPAAPSDFSRSFSTLLVSATSIRNRVMQASTLTRFSRPPNAEINCSALLSAAALRGAAAAVPAAPVGIAVAASEPSLRLAFCSCSNSDSISRPGVRMFHFVIAKRNST